MPQCSKCGKEISQYGLCQSCQYKATQAQKRSANYKPIVPVAAVCPACESRYCEAVGLNKFRCCACDFVFERGDKQD